jgi:hypothetical protein
LHYLGWELKMLVCDLVEMPISEYYRWAAFMKEKTRRESGEAEIGEGAGRISPEDFARRFGADV